MSHDGRYRFHMGCGEALSSQWCKRENPLLDAAKPAADHKLKKVEAQKANTQEGRKG